MATKPALVENPIVNNAPAPDAVANKANEIAAQVAKEIAALDTARKAYHKAISDLGTMGRETLATRVGESVNAFGRPGLNAWHDYMTMLAFTRKADGKPLDFKDIDRLHSIARKAVGTGEHEVSAEKTEKFVKAKGAGNADGKASCTLSMLPPASWKIDLGA